VDEVLRKAGLFQGVDPEDAEALSEQFEIFEAPRGTILFHEGEPGDSLYIVLGGKVKLGRRSSDGRENLVAIMGPADQFGELSIFDPGPRTATATVVTDARLARLPKPALQKWVQERPQIAMQLLRVVARRLRRTNTMLELAQRFGSVDGGQLRVTHDLTQEELAQLVGASRETVNKALADFAQRGWLRLEGKSVVILDRERLSRRAR